MPMLPELWRETVGFSMQIMKKQHMIQASEGRPYVNLDRSKAPKKNRKETLVQAASTLSGRY